MLQRGLKDEPQETRTLYVYSTGHKLFFLVLYFEDFQHFFLRFEGLEAA